MPFSVGSRIATHSTCDVIEKTYQDAETGYLQVSVGSRGALNGSSGPGASDERHHGGATASTRWVRVSQLSNPRDSFRRLR